MGLEHLLGKMSSSSLVHVELAGWGTGVGSSLDGVVLEHAVHELVIARSWATELLWDLSFVWTKAFLTFKPFLRSWVAWMWLVLVPLSGDSVVS